MASFKFLQRKVESSDVVLIESESPGRAGLRSVLQEDSAPIIHYIAVRSSSHALASDITDDTNEGRAMIEIELVDHC